MDNFGGHSSVKVREQQNRLEIKYCYFSYINYLSENVKNTLFKGQIRRNSKMTMDLRDLLAQDRESNINIKDIKIKDTFDVLHLTSFADGDERSKSSTSYVAEATRTSDIESTEFAENYKPEIVTIGVTMKQTTRKSPDRRSFNISVIYDDNSKKEMSCDMAHYERKRELKGTIKDKRYLDWWGYDSAIDFMKNLPDPQESYVGKMKNKSRYVKGVAKTLPILSKTAAVHWVDDEGIFVMLWLGDSQYLVQLNENINENQKNFYIATGYWIQEAPMEESDF